MDVEPGESSIKMAAKAFGKIFITTLFFYSLVLLLLAFILFTLDLTPNGIDFLVLADIGIFLSSSCVLALGKLISPKCRLPNLLGFLEDQAALKSHFYSDRVEAPKCKAYMEKVRSVNLVVSILILIVTLLMILNHEVEKVEKGNDHPAETKQAVGATGITVDSNRSPSNEPVSKGYNGRPKWVILLSEVIKNDLSQNFRKFMLHMNYFLGLLCFLSGLWTAEILDTAANPFVDRAAMRGILKQRFFYHEAIAFGGSGYYYVTIGFFSLLVLSIFSLLLSPVVITLFSICVIWFASIYFYGYYEKQSVKNGDPLNGRPKEIITLRKEIVSRDSDTELRFRCSMPICCGVFCGTLSAGIVMGAFMYFWPIGCVTCENFLWWAWIAVTAVLSGASVLRIFSQGWV